MFRKSKFNAVRTEVDGIKFASKKEAARYQELKLLERGKAIDQLRLQERFQLVVNGVKIGAYVADFFYNDRQRGPIVEDAKGYKTDVYKLKKKLVKALYGIEIQEV